MLNIVPLFWIQFIGPVFETPRILPVTPLDCIYAFMRLVDAYICIKSLPMSLVRRNWTNLIQAVICWYTYWKRRVGFVASLRRRHHTVYVSCNCADLHATSWLFVFGICCVWQICSVMGIYVVCIHEHYAVFNHPTHCFLASIVVVWAWLNMAHPVELHISANEKTAILSSRSLRTRNDIILYIWLNLCIMPNRFRPPPHRTS